MAYWKSKLRQMGASNLTYAEATWTQQLPDWTGAHVRMFCFFGGAPKLPDNLKSGVAKASFYDPEINRIYGAFAAHYSVGILPARPYKPRDKAKVEARVRFAQTSILGRLRAQALFSLAECDEAIALIMNPLALIDFPVEPVIRSTFSGDFAPGRGGLSSCSACPCHRAVASTPPK